MDVPIHACRLVLLLGGLLLISCAEPQEIPPAPQVVSPALAPPPPRATPLTREQVLEIGRGGGDPAGINRTLDRRRFAFELNPKTLLWFGGKNLPADVLNYLEKRSRVDWEATREDVDPDSPP